MLNEMKHTNVGKWRRRYIKKSYLDIYGRNSKHDNGVVMDSFNIRMTVKPNYTGSRFFSGMEHTPRTNSSLNIADM